MKKSNIFWVSYSDLMTSLFFVMLVLFVVAAGYLFIEKNAADAAREAAEAAKKASEEQLDKIDELTTSTRELPEEYFLYQPKYKRFKLKRRIQFNKGDSKIKAKYHNFLIDVGESILDLVKRLNSVEKYKDLDIQYLVVIEGMASKDDYSLNYELSYERALALFNLWEENGILFEPDICEVQIAGSGTGGIREFSGEEEFKNQQFLIHIIPKMGEINLND